MTFRSFAAAGAVGAVLLVSACGLDTSGLAQPGGDDSGASSDGPGVDAPQMFPDGGVTDSTSPIPDAAGSADAPKDTGSAADAPHDAPRDVAPLPDGPVEACAPTGPESCTNGIDDDCNGLTDCEDPACTNAGYACVPDPATAGAGWSFAPLNPGARPTCPSPLMPAYVDVNPTNLSMPASCSCACDVGTQPDCESGNITASFGNMGCTNSAGTSTNGGACQNAGTQGYGLFPYMSATTTPTGGTCQPSVTTTIPANNETHGETCSGETQFGKGCAAGQVCALVPSGFSACVRHDGATTCPAGAYATANSVGAVSDSRACAGCTCAAAPTAMCSGNWYFYPNIGCGGQPFTVVADGQCHQTGAGGGPPFNSYQYVSAAANAMCGAPTGQPQPTGSASLTGQATVCCE